MLLSAAAAALVVDPLPGGATLRDLGEHRFKGLGRAERVFQLAHPDLPVELPAAGHPDASPQPAAGPAVRVRGPGGGARARSRNASADESVRLLTLTGPGGIGKTRLALRAAADQLDRFEDGAFFVDLAAARDSEAVLAAIASAIGFEATAAESLLDELRDRLRDEHVLLILDNFEQVTAAAPTVAQLLQDCAGCSVLVTSREALHVSGEHLFAVPPLSLPDMRPRPALPPSSSPATRRSSSSSSARGRSSRTSGSRTTTPRPSPRSACGWTACRWRSSSPRRASTSSRPRRCSTGSTTACSCCAAARATCPPASRRCAARSTGATSCSSPASSGCSSCSRPSPVRHSRRSRPSPATVNGRPDRIDTLDGLASLVDKSLVRQAGANGDSRFVMLETIREYAAERLDDSPEFDAAARRAHAAYFADFARRQWEGVTADRATPRWPR